MSLTKLQRIVVDALEDIKALDIRVFDTRELSDLFDRVIVASATSNRQTRALASHLREKVKENGFDVISTEGEDSGEWVLVDLGDVIVHLMQPAIRTYYNLEELWGRKTVRVRLGGPAPATRVSGLKPATAAGTLKAKVTRPPVTKSAGTKTAGTKTAGTKTAGTKTAGTKSAGTKAPAKKATATRAARKPS